MNHRPAPETATRRAHSKARALTIAAYCLEENGSNAALVAGVRKLAGVTRFMEEAKANAPDHRWSIENEERRIARQRNALIMIPDTRARDKFIEAVLNRARELIEGGKTEAADALLEFMPSRDAENLLNELFGADR